MASSAYFYQADLFLTASSPLIHLDRATFAYGNNPSFLQEASLTLEGSGFYFLTAPSGTGKTSFFSALMLSLPPISGALSLFGTKTRGLSLAQCAKIRRRIGIVFQDLRLLPGLSIIQNVALPLHIRGFDIEEALVQAKELLAWMGVEVADNQPVHTLSGGERQRVAIARAVMARPNLLLADEPTGQVDDTTAFQILQLLDRLHKIGTTVIVSTHNQRLIKHFSYPVIHIADKKIFLKNSESKRNSDSDSDLKTTSYQKRRA